MINRLPREDIGILTALAWSKRATCVRRKVGCYLVDRDHRMVSHGYNGSASGLPHCLDTPCLGADAMPGTGLDLCQAIHAEANALLYYPDVRQIDTCYCTASPCCTCCKMLLGTGCRRIVFLERYPHTESETMWKSAGRAWIQHTPRNIERVDELIEQMARAA